MSRLEAALYVVYLWIAGMMQAIFEASKVTRETMQVYDVLGNEKGRKHDR
jgi:hypothetical protein